MIALKKRVLSLSVESPNRKSTRFGKPLTTNVPLNALPPTFYFWVAMICWWLYQPTVPLILPSRSQASLNA